MVIWIPPVAPVGDFGSPLQPVFGPRHIQKSILFRNFRAALYSNAEIWRSQDRQINAINRTVRTVIYLGNDNLLIFIQKKNYFAKNWQKWTDLFHIQIVINFRIRIRGQTIRKGQPEQDSQEGKQEQDSQE